MCAHQEKMKVTIKNWWKKDITNELYKMRAHSFK